MKRWREEREEEETSPSLMAVKGMPSSVFIRISFSATNWPLILNNKEGVSKRWQVAPPLLPTGSAPF